MKTKYILMCASSFAIACAGAEFSEEDYLRSQQNEGLCLKLQEQANEGDQQACYALANYHYFGKQFIGEPEKMRASYYKGEDGKSRVYYRLGKIQVEQKDYEIAFKLYEQAALKGHWLSLWSLGECYELGRGTNEDLKKAVECYSQAAKADYSLAQRSLGLMYLEGCGGLPKDDSEGIKLFREAANSGLGAAQYNLGMMYILGRGVKKNEIEAVKWLRKAADQGDARAQTNLGEMYRDGRGGLKKNTQEAIEWYRKAFDQGYEKARPYLDDLRQKIQEQERKNEERRNQSHLKVHPPMTSDLRNNPMDISNQLGLGQICLDSGKYSEAARHFRNAADQGDERACNTLGLMYEDGQGVSKCNSKAAKYYKMAAEKGHAKAQANLGRIYRDGLGVPQNDFEAAKWYRKSADQGFCGGQSNLASMYLQGQGVEKNIDKAIEYWELAARQGYAPAQLKLAEINKILEKTPDSKKWSQRAHAQGYKSAQGYESVYLTEGLDNVDIGQIRQAAEAGDASSQFHLGRMYMDGTQGLERNPDEARQWLIKASNQGDPMADFLVGMQYMSGQGVGESKAEAMKWFEKAAQHDPYAKGVFEALSKREKNKEALVPNVEKAKKIKQWQPSEGDLVRAGDLVMILKRENGAFPSGSEMVSCLQDKMGIPALRAKIILEELGLLEIVK